MEAKIAHANLLTEISKHINTYIFCSVGEFPRIVPIFCLFWIAVEKRLCVNFVILPILYA